jgi:DNA-directed RNA polymerase specialized sigma24 family protein
LTNFVKWGFTKFVGKEEPLEIKAKFERQADGWRVEVPQLDNFVTVAKRLDKISEQIKDLAHDLTGEERCNVIIKVEAIMPGIICDLEAAQEKSREAMRLQEEASAEIRDVVSRMRDEGLTMRDIAVLLGVTPQRVAQLAPCATDE